MVVIAISVAALAAFYAILLGTAAIGFVRARARPGGKLELPRISVIVPARNEETTIGCCLRSILACDYPSHLVEVIVVDDASTDGTAAAVCTFIRDASAGEVSPPGDGSSSDDPPPCAVRLVRIREDAARRAAHKKFALAKGVSEARGDIIVTTDADCVVSTGWLRSMASAFDCSTGMVSGPVLYRRDGTRFGDLQALEFLGLVALGGGLIGAGRPHLCNSANLAYRRRAYYDVGGYEGLENVTTGDDEMLLHKMAYDSDWTIRTCMEPEAVVETAPSRSLAEFFAQRKRWASAHSRYPHARLRLTSMLCYLFYLALALAGAGLFFMPGLIAVFTGVAAVKIAVEAAVLVPAALRFDRRRLLPLLLPAELVQVPYILIIGIAGTVGGFEWKGRRLAQ